LKLIENSLNASYNLQKVDWQKTLSSKKRIWKRCRNDDAWAEIVQMRNSYHDAIKLIKNQFWTNFLNNVKEKEVFQIYKFIKSRLIEKLFSIQNSQKESKIEFNEKCKTFLKAMYSSSLKIQINEELLLNESIQWSRVIEEKIKHAINFSALRKALESDDMSFAIIQWAYKTILKIFNLVYSDLIKNDYHSKIWRDFLFFYFFIKCMQSMTMTLSRRCMYAKLHVIWSKSLLYIFSLINHIDSLHIQALFLNSRHCTLVFLCLFAFFAFYSFVSNNHFLVAIRVFFKYSSVAILSILMMNSVNIVSVFLSWAFSLSFICSAL